MYVFYILNTGTYSPDVLLLCLPRSMNTSNKRIQIGYITDALLKADFLITRRVALACSKISLLCFFNIFSQKQTKRVLS